MDSFPIVLILSLVLAMPSHIDANEDQNIFNILDYGATGDGNADDTLAFIKMWNDTCNAKTAAATMNIPKGKTFMVQCIAFSGPCNPTTITIMLLGTILAPNGPSEWMQKDQSRWLAFSGITGLSIIGPGLIDGRGQGWWNITCRINPKLKGCITLAPTALSFSDCNKILVSNIQFINSPQTHILIFNTNNVHLSLLNITAPETSPNTDGIHLQQAQVVSIDSSNIGTGDDCVSIGDYTSNINITNINCGPGHGVSIGSLGRDGSEAKVDTINVSHVNFFGSTNGARIKTWQAGKGQVRQIVFEHLNFTNVANPIIIDQYYCDVPNTCQASSSAVKISDVSYSNFFGTSKTQVAINLNCSQAIPCTNIKLDTIQLTSALPSQSVNSSCNNAHGVAKGVVVPKSCLVP